MTSSLTCLHGHSLDAPVESSDSSELVCSLCGVDIRESSSKETESPGALALTVVPTSERNVEPGQLVSQLLSDDEPDSGASSGSVSDDESADKVAPTSDFVPADLQAGTEKRPVPAETEAGPEATKRSRRRKKDFKTPSLAGLEVMEELGRGGMGVVYRAFDEKHGREVALKTLQRMGPDDLVRFKQEFRALADIAHRNLASLYELHSDGKTWCLTMELLRGVEFLEFVWSEYDSLKIDGGRRRVADVAADSSRLSMRRLTRLYDVLKQLAVGLNELHRGGKLHSDIKPSNVFVTTEGRLVLLDFGLIAEITRDEDGRMPKSIQGTPHYMAPEQAACRALTEASDWYAVGVMLYEVLTGRLPFQDKSLKAMLRKQYEMPLAPDKRKPGVPKELNDLCMALLEIDPANRPSTVDVLRAVEADDIADSIQEAATTTVVHSADLVGRETHFETLQQSLAEVSEGATRSVFVHGFSGMGKSVLIRRFVDSIHRSETTILLEGRCYEQESVPFKALDSLIDALGVYLCELPAATLVTLMPNDTLPLVRLFPVFGQVPGATDADKPSVESADQQEFRQRALTTLRDLLGNLGQKQPVVLYIDDLQWGDEDSSNLLADLVRPPESPRLLLLGSYRREDVETSPALRVLADAYQRGQDHPHRQELAVDALSETDASRLALSLLGRDSQREKQIAERIGKESGGSPFFVWELAQHVQDDASASVGTLELDEVIWSRVCRLSEESRRLLEVIAVAGRPMRASEAYQTIDERTHGPSLLAQLRTSNFVRTTEQEDDTVVETYHDRIRESVVNHLAAGKVRGHHLKIALVIEQTASFSLSEVESHIHRTPDFAEPGEPMRIDHRQWQRVFDLAYFFDAADKPERALPYALVAAERARSQNALDVAEQQFDIARHGADESGSGDALRFRIAEGLGDVLVMRGRYQRADQQFQMARQLADLGLVQARVDGKRGWIGYKTGEMDSSNAHFERALSATGTPVPSNLLRQLLALTWEGGIQVLHTWFPGALTGKRSADADGGSIDLIRAALHDGLGYPYFFAKGPIPVLWTHLRHMNRVQSLWGADYAAVFAAWELFSP